MEKAFHAIVKGRVQGVFFRAYTRDVALSLGLRGWVRNLSDLSVEVWVEGPKDGLDHMLDWLRTEGSPMSVIESVDITWHAECRESQGFRITY